MNTKFDSILEAISDIFWNLIFIAGVALAAFAITKLVWPAFVLVVIFQVIASFIKHPDGSRHGLIPAILELASLLRKEETDNLEVIFPNTGEDSTLEEGVDFESVKEYLRGEKN